MKDIRQSCKWDSVGVSLSYHIIYFSNGRGNRFLLKGELFDGHMSVFPSTSSILALMRGIHCLESQGIQYPTNKHSLDVLKYIKNSVESPILVSGWLSLASLPKWQIE